MDKFQKTWTKQQTQEFIGTILRAGVLTAAVITFLGGILYLLRYGNVHPSYHVFRGEPADLRSISGIFRDLFALRGRGIIQFGLLLLIATPVTRVAFSILAFALQRDRIYVVITLIVLTTLIYSIIGGGL